VQVVQVTDISGNIVAPDWLKKAELVHRQLRPHLPADYAGKMEGIFAHGGRMAVVVVAETVVSVAVWRVIENTFDGKRVYVDDLVSDEQQRSQGAGKLLLDWLETQAIALGCDALTLDSGVQRHRAHRFYFREGMHVSSYCFRKALK
jgi:hypothetical protein